MSDDKAMWAVVDGKWHRWTSTDIGTWWKQTCGAQDRAAVWEDGDLFDTWSETDEHPVCGACVDAHRTPSATAPPVPAPPVVKWAESAGTWHRFVRVEREGLWWRMRCHSGPAFRFPSDARTFDAIPARTTEGTSRVCERCFTDRHAVSGDASVEDARRVPDATTGIEDWRWARETTYGGPWHAYVIDAADTGDRSVMTRACDMGDADGDDTTDHVVRIEDFPESRIDSDYGASRFNCALCSALWPWVLRFEKSFEEATHDLKDRQEQVLDLLAGAREWRKEARRSAVVRDAAVERSTTYLRERDDAINASLLRIRERDNAHHAVKLMKGARERDHIVYDRMKGERDDAVDALRIVNEKLNDVRDLNRRLGRELTELVRQRHDCLTTHVDRDPTGIGVDPGNVSSTVFADAPVREGRDTVGATRYGRIETTTGVPMPFTPVCSLCPDGGRRLMDRTSHDSAVDGIVFHVMRRHAVRVPALVESSGYTTVRCGVVECTRIARYRDANEAKHEIVRHEIEVHPQTGRTS